MSPRPFLTADWRFLVMANYEVDPAVLEPLVPSGTQLDSWSGATLVSVVAFRFLRTRFRGVPVPLHRHFDEVNLRFYVRRETGAESRRGVVFIREIVPRRAIAFVARRVYNEPYAVLPVRSEIGMRGAGQGAGGRLRYEWYVNNRWCSLAATTVGRPALPAPGSLAEFITEHYWGYTSQRSGATLEYEVEHPRWAVWEAHTCELDCDVNAPYGSIFARYLQVPPRSAFVAEGSSVSVYAGAPLAAAAL